jgi:ATP-binding cassette subfamily C protein
MQLFSFFVRRYPTQSLITLACLALALSLDALGLSATLPLIGVAAGGEGASEDTSPLKAGVIRAFAAVGVEPTLSVLMAVVATSFTLKAGLVLLAKRQVGYTVAHVATDLRLELLRAVLATRWTWFTRQPTGIVANSFATEADRASRSYLEMAQIVAYSMEALLYAGLALAVSWQATLGAIGAAAVTMGSLAALVAMAGRAGRKQTHLLKVLLSRLTDTLHSVKLLKSTGRERLIGPLLEHDTERLNRALRKQVLAKESLRALQEPILVYFVLAATAVMLIHLEMPFANAFMIILLFARSQSSVNKTQRRYQHMVTDASALWSLRELVDRAEAEREPAGGGTEPSLDRGITLHDVTVRYDDERAVLTNASLEIPAGQITAIIGPSGSGKTTLIDLVTGLLHPESGEVRIDDTPLPELDLHRWRVKIGYVPQEMLLLHDSVRMNVTLGDPEYPEEEIERALREAGAWEFVSQLPEGIESSVGERGTLLSGGQRQRIAIARALLRRPRLLILDEATAALDPETESAVWQTIEALRGRTTVVAISHQPALVGVADRVYRIEDGTATLAAPGSSGGQSDSGSGNQEEVA